MGGATHGVLVRPRLIDALDRSPTGLCLVTAPGGFGKTTLLRTWVDAHSSEAGAAIVWVALSPGITTRRAFWQTAVTSTARSGYLDDGAARGLRDEIEVDEDPAPLIAKLLESCEQPVLVLDAYEHLRDITADVDDDILRLIEAVPHLKVVVTTRAPTRLGDRVRQMHGRVDLISERDMAFAVEEVALLLGEHAPHARTAATRIRRATHGYPLAIRAIAFALQGAVEVPEPDSVEWRSLVSADLRTQLADRAMIDFIVDTCVPPYFDAELARTLTTSPDVEHLLAELEWNGFGRWIPYAAGRPAFQYVESVRDVFLAELISADSRRYARDAGVAGRWLHENGEHELALGLAIDAGQYDLASSITRSLLITSPDTYMTDRFDMYLRRVPRSVLSAQPVLALARGLGYTPNPATRGAVGEYLQIAAARAMHGVGQLAPRDVFFHHTMRVIALRLLGKSRESAAAAVKAIEFYDAVSGEHLDDLAEFRPLMLRNLAYSLFQVGEVDQAQVIVSRAVASTTAGASRNYTLAYGIGIHAVNGSTGDARAALELVDPEAWPRDQERSFLNALGIVGAATLDLDEFDFDRALGRFTGGESFVNTAEFWPFIACVLMHARLGRGEAGSEARRVEEILRSSPPPPGMGPNLGSGALFNTLAILWMATGRLAKARPLLDAKVSCPGQLAPARMLHLLVAGDETAAVRALPRLLAQHGHTIRSRAATLTLGAAASVRVGNNLTAGSLLEQAASLWTAHGVRAHLMYLPAADLAALREFATGVADPTCTAYLDGDVASPLPANAARGVQLSERERAVLLAFTEHATVQAVAAALIVSPNTVKSQLRSSYRKLGVATRDEALQRAIELDLF